jgi:Fe-Mn family superoxide dismutase
MITLPTLDYDYGALSPIISERTMRLHHSKHHAAYMAKTNMLAEAADLEGRDLRDIVIRSAARGPTGLYNNAAQAWNHAFFWRSMTPTRSEPTGDLMRLIERDFGGFEAFKAAWVKAGAAHFGSGWLWLVWRSRALKIVVTHDARNFLTRREVTPLLVCDLWEHAYYLDHQNDRTAYLKGWIDNLANWAFAEAELEAAPRDRPPLKTPAAEAPYFRAA